MHAFALHCKCIQGATVTLLLDDGVAAQEHESIRRCDYAFERKVIVMIAEGVLTEDL